MNGRLIVSLGWSATLQDDTFTLYEVSCSNSNSIPVVTKSIQLNKEFVWTVSYKGHIVSQESQLLNDLPSLANTGMYLLPLIAACV